MRGVFVLALVACHEVHAPEPGSSEDLAVYLHGLAGADEATRTREVSSWIIDDATWNTTIVEPWRQLYTEYARGYDAAAPALVARLAAPAQITARRHFAGDPRLTHNQARLRWAVPVQYPSMVAELGGTPIDTVFLYDRGHWRALLGVDELVMARVRTLDPTCAQALGRAGTIGRCTEVGWLVADSALLTDMKRGGFTPTRENDRERFAHACKLATSLCGTGSE